MEKGVIEDGFCTPIRVFDIENHTFLCLHARSYFGNRELALLTQKSKVLSDDSGLSSFCVPLGRGEKHPQILSTSVRGFYQLFWQLIDLACSQVPLTA